MPHTDHGHGYGGPVTTPPIPARPATFWGPIPATSGPDDPGEEHEVLVVGAGIVGLTTALLLARAGRDVAVVDARRPGAGTTGGSTAKATLLQGTTAGKIRSQHGAETLRDYLTANASGQDLIRGICGDSGTVDVQVRDAWTYATSAAGARSVREEHAALAEAGLPVELRVPEELPFVTLDAVRLPDQVQINPAQYLAALLAELAALSVPVVWPYRVAKVASHDGLLRATSTQGLTTHARWVVLATLLPFPLRTLLFATSTAQRSYSMACRIDGSMPHDMYLSADSPSHSLRTALAPTGEQVLLVGGHGHPVGKELPASSHMQGLAQWSRAHFAVREFTHRWSAQDWVTSDVLPQVGPAPVGPEGLLMAGGFGKWGITNGAAAAQVLAGHITDDVPTWGHIYRPRITSSRSGWGRLAATNMDVAANLAKGWLLDPRVRVPDTGVRRDLPVPAAVSTVDGVRRVCSAVCTHLGGIVRWDDTENSWDCPLHGSRFGPDGEVLTGPAVDPLRRLDNGVSSPSEQPG